MRAVPLIGEERPWRPRGAMAIPPGLGAGDADRSEGIDRRQARMERLTWECGWSNSTWTKPLSRVGGLDLTGTVLAGERDGAWQKEESLQIFFFLFKTCLCQHGTHSISFLPYFSQGSWQLGPCVPCDLPSGRRMQSLEFKAQGWQPGTHSGSCLSLPLTSYLSTARSHCTCKGISGIRHPTWWKFGSGWMRNYSRHLGKLSGFQLGLWLVLLRSPGSWGQASPTLTPRDNIYP